MKHLRLFLRGLFVFILYSLFSILYSAPAHAGYLTINYLNSASASTTNGITVSPNKPANTVSGDVMVAFGTIEDSACTIIPPVGWTQISYSVLSTRELSQTIWYKVAASGEPNSYDFRTSDNNEDEFSVSIVSYANVDQQNPIGSLDFQWNNTQSTNCTAPSVNVTTGNNWLIHFCSSAYGTTWTEPGGSPSYRERVDLRTGTNTDNLASTVSDAVYTSSGASGSKTALSVAEDYSLGTHLELNAALDFTLSQSGFRFRENNGSETSAVWLKNQGESITRERGLDTRLRVLVDASGTPDAFPYQLEFKKSTDAHYKKVESSGGSLSFAESGTNTVGTQVVQVPYPPNISVGDLLVFVVANKTSAAVPHTPPGWTAASNYQSTGGSGGDGEDSGLINLSVFTKVSDGSEKQTYLDLVLNDVTSVSMSQMFRYVKGTGKSWDLSLSKASDNVPDVDWIAQGNVNPGITSGDLLFVASAVNSNTPTWSSHTLSASGVTLGSATEREETGTDSGNNLKLVITEQTALSGTASDLPVYSMTGSSTMGNYPTGATVILRLRQVNDPIQLSATSNIASSGENTTAQLQAPAGKNTGDFITGRLMDDENPSDSVSITGDDYSEFEWNLKASSQAETLDLYQFRLTKNGIPLSAYSSPPQWTIGVEAGTPGSITRLEQQINLINQEYFTTGVNPVPSDNSLGLIMFDSQKYDGEVVYFEAIIRCDSCSGGNSQAVAALYTNTGTPISGSAVTSSDTAYTRVRTVSAITSGLSDGQEYTVRLKRDADSGTAYLKSARLIILQNDTVINETQSQVEIGNADTTGAVDFEVMSGPKIFRFDNYFFNPLDAVYFEAVLAGSDALTVTSAALSASANCSSVVYNSEVSVTGAAVDRVRSGNIKNNLVDDTNYWVCLKTTSGKTGFISNAKLILDQSRVSGLQNVQLFYSQINSPVTDADGAYTSQNFFNYYKPSNNSADVVDVFFESTIAAASGVTSARIVNATDNAAYATTEVTTSSSGYARVRTASALQSYLPSSPVDLDTQLKNSDNFLSYASSSWLIVNLLSQIDPQFTFSVSGVAQTQTRNGITTSVSSTPVSLPFGNIQPGIPQFGAHELFASTNASSGYYVTVKLSNFLQGRYPGNNIDAFPSAWNNPTAWSTPTGTAANINSGWLGANTSDTRLVGWTNSASKFFGVDYDLPYTVMYSAGSDTGTNVFVSYGLEVNSLQPADTYSGALLYTALSTY